jgi:hypothetical protein
LETTFCTIPIENRHGHTFYVQYFCHRLFEFRKTDRKTSLGAVVAQIFKKNEVVFTNYRTLLTAQPFQLLAGIPGQGRFCVAANRAKIFAPPTSRRATVCTMCFLAAGWARSSDTKGLFSGLAQHQTAPYLRAVLN